MSEMYSPKSIEKVGKENELQYSNVWPWSADIRRHLTLEYSVPKKDMWAEMAKAIIDSGARRVVEYGCSSGYIIRQLLKQGFDGEVVGIDKEDSYLWAVEESLRSQFPESKALIRLIGADAQSATLDELGGKLFDAGIAANILYHVPKPNLLFKSINEVVKDGGLQIFSTKDIDHQQEVWALANLAAAHLGSKPIQPFYWHFQIAQMQESLRSSKKFSIISGGGGEHLAETLIPDDEEGRGWDDLKSATMSLIGLMEMRSTGLQPSAHEVNNFLESDGMREYLFKRQAAKNGGHFKGRVSMAWSACKNNKPAA